MKSRNSLTLLACVALTLCLSSPARAQLEGTYEIKIGKKAEEKKSNRWTLADWLSWKEQQKAMDMWLAKNSHSSPYEFFLGGYGWSYDRTNGDPTNGKANSNLTGGELGAYAGVAGLRGSYYASRESQSGWSGSFNLRLLGRAIQDTHLNLEYGIQGLSLDRGSLPAENFQNQFAGASVAIYFTKHFGIEGTYHKILPAESTLNRTLDGELSKGDVFIDFGPIRFFGEWTKEMRRYEQSGSSNLEFREGFGGGLKIFF